LEEWKIALKCGSSPLSDYQLIPDVKSWTKEARRADRRPSFCWGGEAIAMLSAGYMRTCQFRVGYY